MMRTERDCVYLSSVMAELNETQAFLLLGLLLGTYTKHPDALFWDVMIDFSKNHLHANRIIKP
jgi:hypothetical protein